MKKATGIFSGLALTAVLALSAFGQTPKMNAVANKTAPSKSTSAQSAKPAKSMAAPKSDSDIQSCISSKLAAASKLKDQGFGVSVSGGTATFNGTAKNAGSKDSVNGIGKSCGAKQVVNHITVESAPKTSGSNGGAKHAAKPKK
jgi:osmotically-inducible protein OsmY